MIFHENCLLADNPYGISYLIFYDDKSVTPALIDTLYAVKIME